MNYDLYKELENVYMSVDLGGSSLRPKYWEAQLKKLGLHVTSRNLSRVFSAIISIFHESNNRVVVTSNTLQAIATILSRKHASVVCDPLASIGLIVATVCESTKPANAMAFGQNETEATLGRAIAHNAKWQMGDSLELLGQLDEELDVVACNLSEGIRTRKRLTVKTNSGEKIIIEGDLGHQILIASSLRLKPDGIGIFILPHSFFNSNESIFRHLTNIGLGVEAAFELPPVNFFSTRSDRNLVIIRKRQLQQIFIGQLSEDISLNNTVLNNLSGNKSGGTVELGRYVDAATFSGIDIVRIIEKVEKLGQQYGAPKNLGEIAKGIEIGGANIKYAFRDQENAIYIPIVGESDVKLLSADLIYRPKYYAQVLIDQEKSYSRFVADYLNSEPGRILRHMPGNKRGEQKLTPETLREIDIYIPPLEYQKRIMDIDHEIHLQELILNELNIELVEMSSALWGSPIETDEVARQLETFSERFSDSIAGYTGEQLDKWIETLPFPLASILRAWQATASEDYKTKYEHLLHFFEATTEFLSIILLSAFSSNETLFKHYKSKINESLNKQNLSWQKATFGTWKVIIEYLGKQTRQLLAGESEKEKSASNNPDLCAEIFADPSLALPRVLSNKELPRILSEANKKRNDWTGHGGIVGQEEAKKRNQQLLTDLQSLRGVFSNIWKETHLIFALQSKLRRGVHESQISLLKGSNSEFLKETRSLSTCLDVEELYLSRKGYGRVLRLLPLVKVGPSPQSAKNACYFFNRVEKEGLRFVSYHSIDQPEMYSAKESSQEITALLSDDY